MRIVLVIAALAALIAPASAEECAFFDDTGRKATMFIGDAGEFLVEGPGDEREMCSYDRDGTYCDTGIKPPIEMIDAEHFRFDGAEWVLRCFDPA
jgi:hypothetical protein